MVLPSPTMMVNRKLKAAAHEGSSVLLTGVTMGGGPSQWGAEEIIRSGGKVFATPEAARTFNDDLEKVSEAGITIVSSDEGARLLAGCDQGGNAGFRFRINPESFQLIWCGPDDLDALAVAVFDHGAAPSDVSDRKFRFDYLDAAHPAGEPIERICLYLLIISLQT